MPTLKARVNNTWVPISGGAQEVAVGPDDPLITDPSTLLWFDVGADQLLVNVNRRWQQATAGTNEVFIGPLDPSTLNPGVEMWVDTRSTPPMLNAWIGGSWKPVTSPSAAGSEVELTDTDPYTSDPAALTELWYDTSTDPGVLKARVAGAWVDVTTPPLPESNEVQIGGADPGFDLTTELWFDTTVPPGALMARVDGTWVAVTSPVESLPPGGLPNQYLGKASTADYAVSWQDVPRELPVLGTPGQVLTKTGPVNPLGVEWSDTSGIAPWVATSSYARDDVVVHDSALYVCRADVAAGGLAPPGNPGFWAPTGNEVSVGGPDPYTVNPTTTAELWYDAAAGPVTTEGEVYVNPNEPTDPAVELWYDEDAIPTVPTHGIRALWVETVDYMPGDQVLWPPDGMDIWLAGRETVGEVPGDTGINDGVDFSDRGATPTVPQGFSAALTTVNFAAGPDIRYHTGKYLWGNQWLGGYLVTATNAANIAIFSLATITDGVDHTLDTVRLTVMTNTAVPISMDVLISELDTVERPFLRGVADVASNTLHLYDSIDGVNWTERGTPVVSPNAFLLAGITALHIGHDNDDPMHNWGGPQSEVEVYNYGGILQTSWVAFTQPSNPHGPNYPSPAPDPPLEEGVGISPKTGEDYVTVGAVGTVWLVDRYPAWSNASGMVHWTNDPAYEGTQSPDGHGIAFFGGAHLMKPSGAADIRLNNGTVQSGKILTTSNKADLGYTSQSVNLVAGQYYLIANLGNPGSVSFTVGTKAGHGAPTHIVQGVAVYNNAYASIIVLANTNVSGKAFDQACVGYSNGVGYYHLSFRALVTGTYTVGIEARDVPGGNPAAQTAGQVPYYGNKYATVDL